MKLQLTISLLVSDREDTVERCLESLTPLLRELDSELIVVWTGSSEAVLDIVKRYTDQIIPFEWCRDFSKARNVGYDAAKGEWFLYLDDDEWFDDVSEILRFFQTGEERLYNTAVYLQRNYEDWRGEKYSDAWVCRMCRKRPDVRFANPVHEVIMPTYSPRKVFNVFVHHYGYVDKQKTLLEKSDRNLPLLLEALKADPDNLHSRCQLAREYGARERYDEAVRETETALRSAKKNLEDTAEITSLRALQIEFLRCQGKIDEAVKRAKKFLCAEDISCTGQVILYSFLLNEMRKDKERFASEGLLLLQRYDEACRRLAEEPEESEEIVIGMRMEEYIGKRSKKIYFAGAAAAFELGDKAQASRWFSRLFQDASLADSDLYLRTDAWKDAVSDKAAAVECLAAVESEDCYIQMQKVFALLSDGEKDKAYAHFCDCAESGDEILYPQLIKAGLRQGWDIVALVTHLARDQWDELALELLREEKTGCWEELTGTVREATKLCPVYFELYLITAQEEKLLRNIRLGAGLIDEVTRYSENVIRFYSQIYNRDIMERIESGEQTPDEIMVEKDCRFALVFLGAFRGDGLEEKVAACKRLYRIYPRMAVVVERVLRELQESLAQSANAVPPEFYQLAGQVKQQVRMLYQNGQWSDALNIVRQLLQLTPADREAVKMKQQILERMAEDSEE